MFPSKSRQFECYVCNLAVNFNGRLRLRKGTMEKGSDFVSAKMSQLRL